MFPKTRSVFSNFPSLHQLIFEALMSTDEDLMLPSHPVDPEDGLNFIVKKTKNGDYADYKSQSAFSTKPTSLTEDELAALEQYGPWNLKKLLPAMPSDDAYAVLPEILEAGINGEPWNPEWNEYFHPRGQGGGDAGHSKPTAPMVKNIERKAKVETPDDDGDEDSVEDARPKSAKTQDLLAKLKAKSKATEE